MIPKNLTRQDILQAIKEVDANGIPLDRHSTKWSVLHDGKHYPPKYLIGRANKIKNGKELHPKVFSGGKSSGQANSFLESLEFEIVTGGTQQNESPITSHSWEVLSSSIAIKHLDKSAFHHHGTGIPAEIRPFFGLEDFLEGENRPTTLLYKGKSFSARFYVDPIKRLRLFWKADFDDVLKKELPGWFEKFSESEEVNDEPPVMRFEVLASDKDTYSIEFISNEDAIQLIDDTVEQEIKNNTEIDETERKALVSSRRGQGRFRQNLASIEKCCRVTGVTDPRLLRASHIKPWRSCANNHERLDGYNGLLLAPHIDHLFDRGYISFSDEGNLLVSPRINPDQLSLLGISLDPTPNVGSFTKEQKSYLEFHRTSVFGMV